ncbi:cytochrome c oxidase copper chaperone [Anser cygnoides]|uniref:Cytochrome c oxidase copper chaperone n=1 Tax=Anser brachyrhynchus TaxID=132585 RepID=A0A8B9C042_9AVES|nr:cytochrome c oxidase copper chaperone [Anser cygnoides]
MAPATLQLPAGRGPPAQPRSLTRNRGAFQASPFASRAGRAGAAMSSVAAASCETKGGGEAKGQKQPLKPCCACPDTKKARDACIIEKGEENCGHLIEAHKECMRALGFKI